MAPKTSDAALAQLDVEELKKRICHQLAKPWARLEKAVKGKIAPLLYHLRKKLHAPGNRSGEGWAAWVDENLSISVRQCNRWTAEYAKQKKLPGWEEEEDEEQTSRQMSSGRKTADGKAQIDMPVGFIGTKQEKKEFLEAWKTLGDEEAWRVIFKAVVTAAAAAKKGDRHAPTKAHSFAAAA